MNRPRLLAVAFAAAVLLEGCAASAPTSGPSAAETVAPATATPTMRALPSGPLFSFALPSFDLHGAPQLEATIPDTIDGQSMRKVSTDFARLNAAVGGDSAQDRAIGGWIGSLGENPTNVKAAAGFSTGTPTITVLAIQLTGRDPTALMTTLRLALRVQGITPTETTVNGKTVLQFSDPTNAGTTSFAYVHQDVVYVTQSTDPAAARTAVEALP